MKTRVIHILVCLLISSSCWAREVQTPCGEKKILIFSSHWEFDDLIRDGFNKIEQLYKPMADLVTYDPTKETAAVLTYIPRVGKLFEELSNFLKEILENSNSWHATVSTASQYSNLESRTKTMKEFFSSAGKELNVLKLSSQNYYDCVNNIYQTLQKQINEFSVTDSSNKKHTLSDVPLLFAISIAVAAFEPIAANLMPEETREQKLPCHVSDLLVDYRSASVDERIDMLKIDPENKFSVRAEPYNPNGYTTSSGENSLDCKHDSTISGCENDPFYTSYCNRDSICRIRCVQYIRRKIEEMFPVDQLNLMCENQCPKTKPAGKFIRFLFLIQ